MLGGRSGGMEADDEKKLNDDLVVFMRKRSETEAPRYTARLKTYVDFQQKRRRAAAARRHTEYEHVCEKNTAAKKRIDNEVPREKSAENNDNRGVEDDRTSKGRRGGEKGSHRPRSFSNSRSEEPIDACRRRRRRSRCRRSRRRRRSCRRRRRRSCSRRRRRRSCRRRRRCRRGCR